MSGILRRCFFKSVLRVKNDIVIEMCAEKTCVVEKKARIQRRFPKRTLHENSVSQTHIADLLNAGMIGRHYNCWTMIWCVFKKTYFHVSLFWNHYHIVTIILRDTFALVNDSFFSMLLCESRLEDENQVQRYASFKVTFEIDFAIVVVIVIVVITIRSGLSLSRRKTNLFGIHFDKIIGKAYLLLSNPVFSCREFYWVRSKSFLFVVLLLFKGN